MRAHLRGEAPVRRQALLLLPLPPPHGAHLLPLVTMIPFSVEKESEGNPWMFQSRTLVGLVKKLSMAKRGEQGT